MDGGTSLPGCSVKEIQAGHIHPGPAPGLARAEAVFYEERFYSLLFCPAGMEADGQRALSPAPFSQPCFRPAPTPPHVQPVRALTTKLALCDFIWLLLAQAGCWRRSQM